jgi:ribose transport system permease protein
MNATTQTEPEAAPATAPRRRLSKLFGFGNISAIYILIALVLIFSLWIPETFLTATTWRTLIDSQAIVALAAVALVLPLATGVFNLAVGTQVGAAGIIVGALLAQVGLDPVTAILLTLVIGILIGLAMGLVIVYVRIDSFIATMGFSSLLIGLIAAVSNGQQILNLPESFSSIGVSGVFGITTPIIVLVVVSLIVWHVLERTPLGRRIYATGGNKDAARLSGVNTTVMIIGSLMACGAITAIAGVLVTSRLANADPTVGPGYLLPAFTAAFLGSTQFREGRFNVFGTILAVYVLAIGVKGLQLAGAPFWIPDVFNGAALLLAVGFTRFTGGQSLFRRGWNALRRERTAQG